MLPYMYLLLTQNQHTINIMFLLVVLLCYEQNYDYIGAIL